MDDMQETARRPARDRCETPASAALAPVTNAERDFWRRAVEIERARQRCPRPAPFPFQPA
jgi:hypothetical protein